MYRVIIADDEQEFRTWLHSLLSRCQMFQVIGEARSGDEAIDMVRKMQPDLVIADLYMPDQDGLELTHNIVKQFPNTLVIIISAYHERAYKRLAIEEGAITFIPKVELSTNTLLQALQKVA